MKHILTLFCAIFLLTFSPYLLANQVPIKGSGPLGYHDTNSDVVGPASKGIAVRLNG